VYPDVFIFCHLKGSGVRYGASVSTNILFSGIFEAATCISDAFLKVTIPENQK
jgi:hypothetical protein